MNNSIRDRTAIVVTALSDLIAMALAAQLQEEANPQHTADAMDDWIKFHRDRVANLRAMRNDFEDELARDLPR